MSGETYIIFQGVVISWALKTDRNLRRFVLQKVSPMLISESFSSSNSLKIGSEWESKVDLETIIVTQLSKET